MSIKRNEDESFEDYKERRAADNAASKQALKPKMFWDSYNLGTYVKRNVEAKRKTKIESNK